MKPMPKAQNFPASRFSGNPIFSGNKRKMLPVVNSAVEEFDVISVQSGDITDQQEGGAAAASRAEMEGDGGELAAQVSGFGASEGLLSLEGFSSASTSSSSSVGSESESMEKLIDRTINATIVLTAGTFAITKLLTIDHNYWQVSQRSTILYLKFSASVCVCVCVCVCLGLKQFII